MKTTEDRIWIFIAYKNDGYGDTPFFSKLFTDHTELKAFSAAHSELNKDPTYSSTYLDLTDRSLIDQIALHAKEEERKRIIDEYGHYSPSDGSECEEYLSTALKEEALLSPKTNPND